MLMSGATSKASLQQHLESLYKEALTTPLFQSLYKEALARGQTEEDEERDAGVEEEDDGMNEEEEYNAQYQYQRSQSLGSRLQGLQIHQANHNVEEWQKNSSEYMDYHIQHVQQPPVPQSIPQSLPLPRQVVTQSIPLPRQVSNVNLYSDQPPFTILGLVEKCFLKFHAHIWCCVMPIYGVLCDVHIWLLCVTWHIPYSTPFVQVCSIGCKNGVQLRYVRANVDLAGVSRDAHIWCCVAEREGGEKESVFVVYGLSHYMG
eukprot:sb/3468467/